VRNDLVGRATQMVGAPRAHAWLYVDQWIRAFWRIATGVLILAAAGRRSWTLDTAIHDPAERGRLLAFLASWWLLPLVLFSLMQTKHEWYALPSYVPAYILAGWLLAAGLMALHGRVPSRYRTAVVGGVGVALLAFVSGKTLSTLLKHHPVAARTQRVALERWLAVTSRACQPPCEIGLFRAYEQQAARFYLTRAGLAYRGFDAWSLPVTSRPLLAKDGSAAELRRVLPSVRPVAEFPALSLTLVELP